MKTALSAIAVAAVLTLTPVLSGSFAVADDSAQRGEEQRGERMRFSPEDRAAFLDARIAALKAGLELNAEQDKNWPPLESAIRELAKQRAERFAAWRERRENSQDDQDDNAEVNPIDRLSRASERLSARAADLQKLAAAAKPLYDSLDDSQKRRFAVLFHRPGGRGQWRHWRRDG